jgi:hypothetical protein
LRTGPADSLKMTESSLGKGKAHPYGHDVKVTNLAGKARWLCYVHFRLRRIDRAASEGTP